MAVPDWQQLALNAGILAIWMNTNGRTWDPELPLPDIEVSSLGEVVALLGPAGKGRS